MRTNWERGTGSARSGIIVEVVANGLIPSNSDCLPYASFISRTAKFAMGSPWQCDILDHERTVLILVSCLLHKCEEGDPVSLSSAPSSHPPPLRQF